LVSQNKEVSYFAGIIAHDVKAPIKITSNFINLIKKRLHGSGNVVDERIDKYIKLIEESNANQYVLIDDLLEYTKSGQTKSNFEPIDLNKILDTVRKNLSFQIEKSSAKISASPLPCVTANKSDMVRLFQNIISNAIKFQKEKTPVITIETESTSNYNRILIHDNGIGIDKKHIDSIFNPLV